MNADSDYKNPFDPPVEETKPAVDEIHNDVMALVKKIAWVTTSDGDVNYTQNRLGFAQATAMVGAVCDINDADSVYKAVGTYYEMCKANDTLPSVPGLANALGKDAAWLKRFRNPNSKAFYELKALPPDSREAIADALRILDQTFIQMAVDNKIQPTLAGMLGVNYHGMVQRTEHVVEHTDTREKVKSDEEIIKEMEALQQTLILDVDFKEVE